MDARIPKKRAIEYVILCHALLLMLLVGPMGVLDGTRETVGTERMVRETRPVAGQDKIQQVFLADGGYLEKIGIYGFNDFSRRVFRLTVYDELGEVLFSRKVATETYEAPGFFYIPVEFDTISGRAYVCQIDLPEEELVLGRQDTAETVQGVYGNFYYVGPDGETREQVGENIPLRLVYADPVSAAGKAAMMAGIAAVAGFLVLLVENSARKRGTERKVCVQWVMQRICDPLIGAGAVLGLTAVTVWDHYGGQREDRIVYCAGILIFAALLLYVVNKKRTFSGEKGQQGRDIPEDLLFLCLRGLSWERVAGFLQTVCWAGVLWGCIDHMNAMYTIYQEYAFRKTLIWLGLALLTMCGRETLLSLWDLVWTAGSAAAGFLFCTLRRGDMETEKLDRMNVVLFVVAGLVAIQAFQIVRGKKTAWKRLCIPYGVLLSVLFAFLVVFRNGRGWPLVLAGAFLLLYFFYLSWEGREKFLGIFCNGIILNFAVALVFALLRRPFRAWFFYRYNFVFHTVTVTSAYLSLVLSALSVKLLMRVHRSKKLYDWWLTGLLFGVAASLLVMTLSRTGYLAVLVMGAIVLSYVSLVCYREGLPAFLQKTGALLLVVAACFPVTYSALHLIPPLYDDPYLFELEEDAGEWAIHKGDPADSENYITLSRFAYCLDVKLFGDEHQIMRRFVDGFLGGRTRDGEEAFRPEESDGMSVAGLSGLTASARDMAPEEEDSGTDAASSSGPEEGEDYSNGRMDLFRRYMQEWNLTGHDGMGVELEDGSLSVHAHNTYLQVIHDHGLLVGVVYLLAGMVSLIQMFRYAFFHLHGTKAARPGPHAEERAAWEGRDAYGALPLAVFLTFAVAGLVEWLFHPCNPVGFSTMAVFAPLLTFKNVKGQNTRRGD